MSEQELKVKDLLVKLQILSNGLVEERNNSISYLDRIKEYEESLEKKDIEISDLTKEKFDLKSKLTLERSKKNTGKRHEINNYFSSLFNAKGDNSKITELEGKINQQNYEIKDLTRRLMDEKESFDQQKIKFQTILTIQTQQMKELKNKIANLENSKNSETTQNSEKDKEEREREKEIEREKAKEIERKKLRESEEPKILLSEYNEKMDFLKRKFNSERDGYEKQLGKIRNELREEKEKSELLNTQLNQYKEKFEAKNYENIAMKTQVSKLNDDLNKLKIDFRNKQLAPRMFHVERTKMVGKKAMIISFKWNKNQKTCEMIFKREQMGGKIKEDIINILDVTFKINDKNKETIDISYKVSYIIKYIIINICLFK